MSLNNNDFYSIKEFRKKHSSSDTDYNKYSDEELAETLFIKEIEKNYPDLTLEQFKEMVLEKDSSSQGASNITPDVIKQEVTKINPVVATRKEKDDGSPGDR